MITNNSRYRVYLYLKWTFCINVTQKTLFVPMSTVNAKSIFARKCLLLRSTAIFLLSEKNKEKCKYQWKLRTAYFVILVRTRCTLYKQLYICWIRGRFSAKIYVVKNLERHKLKLSSNLTFGRNILQLK